jgi:hypothetical protein
MMSIILVGMAAILLTLGVTMMLIGHAKEDPGAIATGTMIIVLLIDLLVCAGLVMEALAPLLSIPMSNY